MFDISSYDKKSKPQKTEKKTHNGRQAKAQEVDNIFCSSILRHNAHSKVPLNVHDSVCYSPFHKSGAKLSQY